MLPLSEEVRKLEDVADAALMVRWSPQTSEYWDALAQTLEATGRTKRRFDELTEQVETASA